MQHLLNGDDDSHGTIRGPESSAKKQGFFRAGIITTCQVMTDMADSDGTKMTNVVGCAHAQ